MLEWNNEYAFLHLTLADNFLLDSGSANRQTSSLDSAC